MRAIRKLIFRDALKSYIESNKATVEEAVDFAIQHSQGKPLDIEILKELKTEIEQAERELTDG
jgi:hypothetical protein